MKNIAIALSFAVGLSAFSTVSQAAPNTKVFPQCREYKTRIAGATGKEAAKDVPSWVLNENYRPCRTPNEDGKTFADRAIRTHYNIDNYQKGAATEFNKIQKFGDRGFK